jgi:hypothetical protein
MLLGLVRQTNIYKFTENVGKNGRNFNCNINSNLSFSPFKNYPIQATVDIAVKILPILPYIYSTLRNSQSTFIT